MQSWSRSLIYFFTAATLAGLLQTDQSRYIFSENARTDNAKEWITITPEYPKPRFCCGVVPEVRIPNLEKPDPKATKERLSFKVPIGTTNVASKKPVTSSVKVIGGALSLFTDGNAQGMDDIYVELPEGIQWLQVDLGQEYEIWKVLLWHAELCNKIYFDVIVQCSNDPDFKKDVTTLFNNDSKGEAGLGKGTDPCYVETNHGRLIDGKGARARYVRFYGNGNNRFSVNQWVEASVYGTKPADH